LNLFALNNFRSYISQYDNAPDAVKLIALKQGVDKFGLRGVIPPQWITFINNLEVNGPEQGPAGGQSLTDHSDVGVGYRPGLTRDCQPVPRLKLGG
jgi:hypothetical protein